MNSHAKVIRGTDWAASPNGHSTAKTLPKIVQADNWFTRFKSRFQWESLVVAGREVKGFVVPGWAAGVILASMIGAFGFMYNQNQTQKEMLIRLDERLIERNDRDRERKEELEKRLQNIDAVQIVLRRDLAKLEVQAQNKKGNNDQ